MVPSVTCDHFLYADDTTLIISGNDPREIGLRLIKDLASLSVWLEENKLYFTWAGLKASYLPLQKDYVKVNKMSLTCNDVNISSKSNIKYLGVTLDQDMAGTSFKPLL